MAILNINNMTMTKTGTEVAAEKNAKSVEETFQKMKANLIRYSRSNDRRMVLRSLMDVKLLNCLSLDVAQNSEGPLFDLEKEVAETSMVLNGVEIKGVRLHNVPGVKDTVTSGVKKSSVPILKSLCRDLCDRKDVGMSSRELYEKLIVRLAKSTSSADPYFRLNSLLGSPDLLVMPLKNGMGSDTAAVPTRPTTMPMQIRNEDMARPSLTELNMYVAEGEIHIALKQTYKFGLFRKADVKSNRPWFIITGKVSERSNLSSNSVVRQLKVSLPDNIY